MSILAQFSLNSLACFMRTVWPIVYLLIVFCQRGLKMI